MVEYGLSKTISKKDERQKKWAKQRRKRGFDDTELWNLELTIAKFIVPRLKEFKEINSGFPGSMTSKEWSDTLQQMIDGLELIIDEKAYFGFDKQVSEKINKSIELLFKYYFDLWN